MRTDNTLELLAVALYESNARFRERSSHDAIVEWLGLTPAQRGQWRAKAMVMANEGFQQGYGRN